MGWNFYQAWPSRRKVTRRSSNCSSRPWSSSRRSPWVSSFPAGHEAVGCRAGQVGWRCLTRIESAGREKCGRATSWSLEHDLKKDLRHSLARRPRRRRPATRMTQQEELLRGHCRIQAPAAEIVRPRRCGDSWDVEVEFPDHRQTVAFPSNELRYISEVLRTPVIVQSGYLCKGARVIAVSRSRSTPGRLVPTRKK